MALSKIVSNSTQKNVPVFAIPVAGGFAGAAAWFISFPLDVIKSTIQSKSLKMSSQELSIGNIARQKFRESGVHGFYQGVKPSILRAFFVSGTRFSAYEFAMKMLTQLKL